MMLRRCHPASCDENPGIEHITRVRRAPPGNGGGSPAHRRAPRDDRPPWLDGGASAPPARPIAARRSLLRDPCAATSPLVQSTRNGRNGGNARISIAESKRRIDHRPRLRPANPYRKSLFIIRFIPQFLAPRPRDRSLPVPFARTRTRREFTTRSWRRERARARARVCLGNAAVFFIVKAPGGTRRGVGRLLTKRSRPESNLLSNHRRCSFLFRASDARSCRIRERQGCRHTVERKSRTRNLRNCASPFFPLGSVPRERGRSRELFEWRRSGVHF